VLSVPLCASLIAHPSRHFLQATSGPFRSRPTSVVNHFRSLESACESTSGQFTHLAFFISAATAAGLLSIVNVRKL
jgi:hypothetical protein